MQKALKNVKFKFSTHEITSHSDLVQGLVPQ